MFGHSLSWLNSYRDGRTRRAVDSRKRYTEDLLLGCFKMLVCPITCPSLSSRRLTGNSSSDTRLSGPCRDVSSLALSRTLVYMVLGTRHKRPRHFSLFNSPPFSSFLPIKSFTFNSHFPTFPLLPSHLPFCISNGSSFYLCTLLCFLSISQKHHTPRSRSRLPGL